MLKMNYYGRELNEYKASLHTHSTTSDGRMAPSQVIQVYADAGYDVLAFTDHKNFSSRKVTGCAITSFS